jgi:hypothetical protein
VNNLSKILPTFGVAIVQQNSSTKAKMDWSRCDEIEYDNQYENSSMFHTGTKTL